MNRHEALTQRTRIKVYFDDSDALWQRGLNDTTSGLLCQYRPKTRTSANSPSRISTASLGSSIPDSAKRPAENVRPNSFPPMLIS